MILPDVNLLLYSVNKDSPDHSAAFEWWSDLVHGGEAVGIYSGVAFAFVRLSTNRRVFTHPLSINDAYAYLNNWLSFDCVSFVEAEVEDLATTRELLSSAGSSGNLVSDAQIAAAAIRLKGTVHSADADFGRFKEVNWHNPLGA